ncbi:MAG: nucleotidyltransferase family protein [Deltaproteobacteria bacterium]|nr:nucleotidyltransferase family protein [Deltaproteobacteria bacterium]
MNPRLDIPQDRLAEFCRANGIVSLAIFGSALRDDFGPGSDVDLLVEFAPGRTPGLRFVDIADELSDLFGRPVDVVTRSAVERSPNFIRRRAILESAQVVYAG